MANMDSFSEQIVQYVRKDMSDEAILELVRNKLLGEEELPSAAAAPAAPARSTRSTNGRRKKKTSTRKKAAARKASPARKTGKKKRAGRKSSGRRGSSDRGKEMDVVEKTIKSSKGMSASDISKKTKIPQSRVSTIVRSLKEDRRVYQGGDRRFARYAGDQKTANQASDHARKNAAGPRRR